MTVEHTNRVYDEAGNYAVGGKRKMQKNILCFGDSNTWGYIPGTGERYAPEVR